MDEKVPAEPMVPIGLLSRNTSDPLFQPRIRMLAIAISGGLVAEGGAVVVVEGGFSFLATEGGTSRSTIGNVLGPLACTEMVCVSVVQPRRENSISCLPGLSLMLQ